MSNDKQFTAEEKKAHGFELFHKASEGFDKHFYQISESDLDKFTSSLQQENARLREANEKLSAELLELRGLKNRDQYFDNLNRAYTKGKN